MIHRSFSTARALAALGALGFATAAFGQGGMPPARVEVAIAEQRDLAPLIDVSGAVVSVNDSRIAAEVEGVLVWLADVGDAVDRGDTIARIDPRLIEVAFKRAQANVSRLEADYRYREQQLARTEELALANNASETLLDESRALRDQAMHQLNDARAQLERAQGDVARTNIRAAFAGHVTERLASVGEYVTVGEDVMRLVDTHEVEISVPAPISVAAHVEAGMVVRVRNGTTEKEHPVRAVVPVGDAVSRMVEIRLSAEDSPWLVGTPVTVSLPSEAPVSTVAVPRDALIERGGDRYIYKVNGDGTTERVDMRLASAVGLWVGVRQGVEPGDQVIVRGGERLMPGQAVEVTTTFQ